MKSRTWLEAVGVLVLVLAVSRPAEAQLPKSGTARLHSGWKGIVEAREVGKNHVYANGAFFGMWFNDEGKGFLDRTQWVCVFINDLADGRSSSDDAYCTATDGDGDQISMTAKARSPKEGFELAGMHTIRRGTGKYAGIEGGITFDCKFMGKYDQAWCIHEASYRLP
jgi:hypothetical protein